MKMNKTDNGKGCEKEKKSKKMQLKNENKIKCRKKTEKRDSIRGSGDSFQIIR